MSNILGSQGAAGIVEVQTLRAMCQHAAAIEAVVQTPCAAVQALHFSSTFFVGVPGGRHDAAQEDFLLPVDASQLLYTPRQMVVMLVAAKHARLAALKQGVEDREEKARTEQSRISSSKWNVKVMLSMSDQLRGLRMASNLGATAFASLLKSGFATGLSSHPSHESAADSPAPAKSLSRLFSKGALRRPGLSARFAPVSAAHADNLDNSAADSRPQLPSPKLLAERGHEVGLASAPAAPGKDSRRSNAVDLKSLAPPHAHSKLAQHIHQGGLQAAVSVAVFDAQTQQPPSTLITSAIAAGDDTAATAAAGPLFQVPAINVVVGIADAGFSQVSLPRGRTPGPVGEHRIGDSEYSVDNQWDDCAHHGTPDTEPLQQTGDGPEIVEAGCRVATAPARHTNNLQRRLASRLSQPISEGRDEGVVPHGSAAVASGVQPPTAATGIRLEIMFSDALPGRAASNSISPEVQAAHDDHGAAVASSAPDLPTAATGTRLKALFGAVRPSRPASNSIAPEPGASVPSCVAQVPVAAIEHNAAPIEPRAPAVSFLSRVLATEQARADGGAGTPQSLSAPAGAGAKRKLGWAQLGQSVASTAVQKPSMMARLRAIILEASHNKVQQAQQPFLSSLAKVCSC